MKIPASIPLFKLSISISDSQSGDRDFQGCRKKYLGGRRKIDDGSIFFPHVEME